MAQKCQKMRLRTIKGIVKSIGIKSEIKINTKNKKNPHRPRGLELLLD